MKNLILFIVAVVLANSECFDLELEGTLKLGRDFLKQLDRGGDITEKPYLQTSMRRFKLNNNVIENSPLKVNDSRKPQTENQNDTRKSTENEKAFIHFASVLTTIGIQELHNATRYLKRKCAVNTDVQTVIKTAAQDFIGTLKDKVSTLAKEKYTQQAFYDYDQEYFLLNIVELSSAVFYRKLKIILDHMLKSSNKSRVFEVNTKAMNDQIFTYYVNYKKQGIKMICLQFSKCREYPAFSDFLADFFSDLLKLPRSKLFSFLAILKKLLMEKLTFIVRMLDSEVFTGIIEKLKESNDVENIRESITILRSIITARYKLLYNRDEEVVKRAKAVRVLLDIFDKTFCLDGEVLESMSFGTLVETVRQWSLDLQTKEDLERNLDDFLKYILHTMKHQWGSGVANEINVLIEMLLLGEARDRFTENYLLNKGSLFVRNKIVSGDIQVGVED